MTKLRPKFPGPKSVNVINLRDIKVYDLTNATFVERDLPMLGISKPTCRFVVRRCWLKRSTSKRKRATKWFLFLAPGHNICTNQLHRRDDWNTIVVLLLELHLMLKLFDSRKHCWKCIPVFQTHSDEKPYACEQCDFRFKTKKNCRAHQAVCPSVIQNGSQRSWGFNSLCRIWPLQKPWNA